MTPTSVHSDTTLEAEGRGPSAGDARLVVSGAVKQFGSTKALDEASLELRVGEIHALMGGNGSGKSTLIKCLAGVYTADAGLVRVGVDTIDLSRISPADSRALGLSFVHQDAGVFPGLTVAENLAIGGAYPKRWGSIDWSQMRSTARQVLAKHEINVHPDALMSQVGPAARMQIAVARCLEEATSGGAIDIDHPVLVLDEPTASLPAYEVDLLTEALRGYARRGASVLFVTHRFDEVFALADRVTVMRDGAVSGSADVEDLSHDDLVSMMLGHKVSSFYSEERSSTPGQIVLDVQGLSSGQLHDIDLQVREGEIVGVVGLLGSGRSRLLKSLFGTFARDGSVAIAGRPLAPGSVPSAMDAGVAYVPEDRLADGAFLDRPIEDNLSLGQLMTYWTGIWWGVRRARADARAASTRYAIRSAGPTALMSSLSGGNQQKVVLARWLSRDPRLLLLDEPTQGVDVGSKSQIYDFIRDAAASGTAVLVASSDVEEICHLCDRVVFLSNGTLSSHLSQPLTAQQLVSQLMITSEPS